MSISIVRANTRQSTIAMGNLVRAAAAAAIGGDDILCEPGTYDFGDDPFIPPVGVNISGFGKGITRFRSDYCNTDPKYGVMCCFELTCNYSNLTLESTAALRQMPNGALGNYSSELVGFSYSAPALTGNLDTQLNNVECRGQCFTLYSWSGPGNKCRAVHSDFYGSRWIVSLDRSSGTNDGAFELFDCRIFGDSSPPTAGGEYGLRLIGIVGRGGRILMQGGSIEFTGPAILPAGFDIAGVWTGVYNGNPSVHVELRDVHIRNATSGAASYFDIRNDGGTVNRFGGSGSGAKGDWITSGIVGP